MPLHRFSHTNQGARIDTQKVDGDERNQNGINAHPVAPPNRAPPRRSSILLPSHWSPSFIVDPETLYPQ
jgi:hypothetical protein